MRLPPPRKCCAPVPTRQGESSCPHRIRAGTSVWNATSFGSRPPCLFSPRARCPGWPTTLSTSCHRGLRVLHEGANLVGIRVAVFGEPVAQAIDRATACLRVLHHQQEPRGTQARHPVPGFARLVVQHLQTRFDLEVDLRSSRLSHRQSSPETLKNLENHNTPENPAQSPPTVLQSATWRVRLSERTDRPPLRKLGFAKAPPLGASVARDARDASRPRRCPPPTPPRSRRGATRRPAARVLRESPFLTA